MVQPEVHAPDGTKRLLDDLVPMEWLYVTNSLETQGWMEGLEEVWQGIGGRRLVIMHGDSPLPSSETSGLPAKSAAGIDTFQENDDKFAQWCAHAALNAVLVRPDRYVYGTARDSAELAAKIARLAIWLGG